MKGMSTIEWLGKWVDNQASLPVDMMDTFEVPVSYRLDNQMFVVVVVGDKWGSLDSFGLSVESGRPSKLAVAELDNQERRNFVMLFAAADKLDMMDIFEQSFELDNCQKVDSACCKLVYLGMFAELCSFEYNSDMSDMTMLCIVVVDMLDSRTLVLSCTMESDIVAAAVVVAA